jgi:hypothetical protein
MHLQRQSRQLERAHAAPRSHLPCIFPHAHFPCFPLHTALRISSANQRSGKNSDAHAASEAGSRESGVGTRSVARLGRAAPCGSLLRLITWRLVRLVGLLGGLDADEVVMDGGWVFFGCCGMQGHGFEFVCLLLFLRMEGGRRIVPVWFLKLYPCHPSLPSFLPSMHTAIDTACSCSQT